MNRRYAALLLLFGLILLASCKHKEEEEWIPAPTTALVRGAVFDDRGPVAGAAMHVVYELDPLPELNGTASRPPEPAIALHSAIQQINDDSVICEYELLTELVGLNDGIRLSLCSRREFGLDHYELFRDTALSASWPARNGSGLHMYFSTDRSVTSGVNYVYSLVTTCSRGLRFEMMNTAASTNPGLDSIPDYALYPNYPNPVTDSTHISYFLNASGWIDLTLLNRSGRFVRNIWSSTQNFRLIGRNDHTLSMTRLCNGVYECHMAVADVFQTSRKVVKNQTDYAILRQTPGAATSDIDGNFQMDVAVGDTITLTSQDNQSSGLAVFKRVKIVALAEGYQAADTTLDLIVDTEHAVTFHLTRER